MDSGLLIVLLTASAAIVSCYEIYKSSCRRYSVFRITDRGQKVTWGFIKRINASSLSFCLKGCLDESVCKSFNFNKGANDNCELLSSTRKSGTTYADGWNHYEPIYQSTTPGCMAIGASSPCSPGYICKESCTGNGRFNCIDINECASSPCYNGGGCNNYINHYTCSCAGGFTGTRCQTDINECGSNPCLNGGNCNNHINSYSCSCIDGYSGSRCETAPPPGWWKKRK
ncbi:fibropellin-3-like [Rhopilema esculentum]|uniref:fibropellin-3-like n=1 Tax=Rhopilema esculentum TaxID=499914 RepID=UPI0031E414B3